MNIFDSTALIAISGLMISAMYAYISVRCGVFDLMEQDCSF